MQTINSIKYVLFPLARVKTEQLGNQTRFIAKSQPLFKTVPTNKTVVCLE